MALGTDLCEYPRSTQLGRVPVPHAQGDTQDEKKPVERHLPAEKELYDEAGDDDKGQHHGDADGGRLGAQQRQRDEHGQQHRVEEGKADDRDHAADVIRRRLVWAARDDGEGCSGVAYLHDASARGAMFGVAAQLFKHAPLVVAAGVDMDAAEDAVAQRLVKGFGALEGAPACLERVEVDPAGGLWGAECPDEDSGDEAERTQEVPSDSRLDCAGFLHCHVWHFVVFYAGAFGNSSGSVVVGVVVF